MNIKNLYRLKYIEENSVEFCRLPYGNILQNQNSSQWSCDFVIFISMKWHYNAMMSPAMGRISSFFNVLEEGNAAQAFLAPSLFQLT